MIRFMLACLLLCLASTVHAAIHYVPTEYATIQLAVNALSDGDTILVEEGAYEENAVAEGYTFTLASEFLLDGDSTHIDATVLQSLADDDYHAPLRVFLDDNDSVRVCGLTVTGGRLNPNGDGYGSNYGGGIFINGGKALVENCVVYGNVAYRGGGIAFYETEGAIKKCRVYENQSGGHGGGIYVFLSEGDLDRIAHLDIDRNKIYSNTPVAGRTLSLGGGICIAGEIAIAGTIRRNIIEENVATSRGGGIGFYLHPWWDENVWEIKENTIAENRSEEHAGVRLWGVMSVDFHHNLVRENNAYEMWGSGISLLNACSFNNSIHHNHFIDNYGYIGGVVFTSADCHIYDNIFFENQARCIPAILVKTNSVSDTGRVIEVDHNVFADQEYSEEAPGSYIAAVSILQHNNYIRLDNNDFIGNLSFAAGHYQDEEWLRPRGLITAGNNYWGHPSGPYHADLNPNGQGDTVRTNLDILPFRTEPATGPENIELFYPENNREFTPDGVFFCWSRAEDATTFSEPVYGLQLSYTNDFEEVMEHPSRLDTTITLQGLQPGQDYYWRVYAEDTFGLRGYSDIRFFTTDVEESDETMLPERWELSEPYPNPFNREVRFEVAVPETGDMRVEVFDVLGRKVTTLHNGRLTAGYHGFSWSANTAAGMYFIRLSTAASVTAERKVLYVR